MLHRYSDHIIGHSDGIATLARGSMVSWESI